MLYTYGKLAFQLQGPTECLWADRNGSLQSSLSLSLDSLSSCEGRGSEYPPRDHRPFYYVGLAIRIPETEMAPSI